MAKVEEFIARLHKVKASGPNRWMACCPAHDDRSPSLSVRYEASEDKLLVHCFSGCGAVAVMESIGMELVDLMPEQASNPGDKFYRPRAYKAELFDKLLYESSILRIVCEDFLHGTRPEGDDLVRALEAIRVIANIRDEVARHGR